MLRRLMMASVTGGGTPVPNFANVKWLLNMGGASGSAAFTDATGLRSWAGHGDAKIDTSLGYNAALFDGSGDYIDTPHASDLVLGAQDFCIEGFVRLPSSGSQQTLIEKRGTSFATGDWVVFVLAGAIMIYSYEVDPLGNTILLANGAVPNDGEVHWAWTRSGSTMRLFVGGELKDSMTTSATIQSAATPLAIGRDNVGGGRFFLNGRVRACRGTIGEPVYTSNFIPPAAPFPEA